jgi:hypothetical protein
VATRFTIDPGSTLPLQANDPTGGMLVVESGTFTVRLQTDWAESCKGQMASAFTTTEATGVFSPSGEPVARGDEVTMAAGDAYIPGSINGEIRNDGTEPAIGLVMLVGPTSAMTGRTPTP